MPEGPEIRLAADRVAKALVGRPAHRVWFAFEHLEPFAELLAGEEVARVEPRGKALLTVFANGLVIYSHNQLYGRWWTLPSGLRPSTRRTLRLAIENGDHSALLYSASEIDVLDWGRLDAHPYLAALGPDVLDPALSAAEVAGRLAERRFAGRGLGALLLDQRFLAGIGNYLRAEILFVAGVHPARRPAELDAAARRRLAAAALTVARQAYTARGVTNDLARAARLRAEGLPYRRYRHHVFARAGEPCWTCGARVEGGSVAGRRCSWCPRCQR